MRGARRAELGLSTLMLLGALVLLSMALWNVSVVRPDASLISPAERTSAADLANKIKPYPACAALNLGNVRINRGVVALDQDYELALGGSERDRFVITGNFNCVVGSDGDTCSNSGQGNVIVGMACE